MTCKESEMSCFQPSCGSEAGHCICGSLLWDDFSSERSVQCCARMPYLGVVKRMETTEMLQRAKEFVDIQEQLGYRWVHVHASTPCSSGSPLKNFSSATECEADRSWKGIMDNVSKYLMLGNSRSFELPRNNNIWKRDETKRVLNQCGLEFGAEVFLCQTGLVSDSGLPIGKVLIFGVLRLVFATFLQRSLVGVNASNMQG